MNLFPAIGRTWSQSKYNTLGILERRGASSFGSIRAFSEALLVRIPWLPQR